MEYNRELYHWGVKGQKWGVRRYQNKDGSLTPAGKKRYYREADAAGYKEESYSGRRYKTNKKGKVEGFDADPDKWVTDDTRRTKKVVDETEQLTNKLKRANEDAIRKIPQDRVDLSKMSDSELRERINREMLERQYNDMFTPQTTKRGREHVNEVLAVTGTVLGITGSALGIALSIRDLMGKG